MFYEGVRNVLVNTNSSFRFFIIAVNVLRNNITFTTVCFSDFHASRSNDGVVVMYVVAAIAR
jgi:hypothetical protein